MGGQRSARMDCLHFRSRTSSLKDVERSKALARGGLSARSTPFSGSASMLDAQCSWRSSSDSTDPEANLSHIEKDHFSLENLTWLLNVQRRCCCHRHLSLLVDVSARALGSSSVFFLLIFLCLTVPLSDFPLGSSVKPLLVWGNKQCMSKRSIKDLLQP